MSTKACISTFCLVEGYDKGTMLKCWRRENRIKHTRLRELNSLSVNLSHGTLVPMDSASYIMGDTRALLQLGEGERVT